MNKQDYNATISVTASASQAFDAIEDVARWWTENVDGDFKKVNDVFTVHFGESFVKFKVMKPSQKRKSVGG